MPAKEKESCFKLVEVSKRASIKKVTEENGIKFEKGKAYYQLTKKEVIQDYKKIVVRRVVDGKFITGDAVREILKIPKNNPRKVSVDNDEVLDFEIFVQSTSYNRILLPDTKMIYQIKDLPEEDISDGEVQEKEKTEGKAAAKRKASEDEKDSEPKNKKKPGIGGKVEVVFSFDTTGSMYACLGEVRRGIKQAIQRLKAEVPGIRIAIIAHGDYCDAHSSYVTKIQDFSEDEKTLCKFVENVGATGGGDADECYELVLREARTKLAWSLGSIRSLVMIGDCNPHGPNYPLNKQKINWKTECGQLKDEEIRIYAVQALNRKEATSFYRDLATLTDGFHLRMDQFSSIVNFMMAICFREEGGETLDAYESEVKTGGKGMNRELHRLFDTLQGRTSDDTFDSSARPDGLVPVNPSRFQVLDVPEKCSIKEYVQSNSLIFSAGRGFYEFTKPETISNKKEVVLIDKTTGDMFTGQEAFDMIGAGGSTKIKPTAFESWRVFVQSTSYNRVLMGGTGFLYEVDVEH
eukprot:GFUD01008733.1.p1 GENE.GFUD01008733.1~~GFUD01008733.1.p1  ORF type:complete len:520 (-),score=147.42 GFUD01008733.1:102-1661(-)